MRTNCLQTRIVCSSVRCMMGLAEHLSVLFLAFRLLQRHVKGIGVASYVALGHMPPSTSNCLIFLVTSELHKL